MFSPPNGGHFAHPEGPGILKHMEVDQELLPSPKRPRVSFRKFRDTLSSQLPELCGRAARDLHEGQVPFSWVLNELGFFSREVLTCPVRT